MVEASIALLNSIVIPLLRLTGTSTVPFSGTVEFTWGGVLSGGGSGPLRPHAAGNDATIRTTANSSDGFFIPFTLLCLGGITDEQASDKHKGADQTNRSFLMIISLFFRFFHVYLICSIRRTQCKVSERASRWNSSFTIFSTATLVL